MKLLAVVTPLPIYQEHILAGRADSDFRYAPSSTWIFFTPRNCTCSKSSPSNPSGGIRSTELR